MAVSPEATRASARVDELFRAHERDVYRYALATLGNTADAEDVTQTTFMNALRALERGEQPRNPESWLIVIAHNLVRERYRRAHARPLEVALEPETVGAQQEDDQTKPSVDEIVRAMARIPESQRSALVMREFEGRPYAEIARTLGMTTSALETLLFRARRSLAEELENVMTCARAQAALARLRTEGLSRKERRRLDDHLGECAACCRLAGARLRRPRVLERALLLLPFPVKLFGDAHATSTGGSTAALSTTAGSGVVLGGLTAKVAVVAATAAVASGVGYVGMSHLTKGSAPTKASSHRSPQAAARAGSHASVGRTSAPLALTRPRLSPRQAIGPAAAGGAAKGSQQPSKLMRPGGATSDGAATTPSGATHASGNGGVANGSGSVGKTATQIAPPAAPGRKTTKSSGNGSNGGKSATAGSNGEAKANGQAKDNGQANGSNEPSTVPSNGSDGASGQTTTPSGQASQGSSNSADTSTGDGKGKGSGKS